MKKLRATLLILAIILFPVFFFLGQFILPQKLPNVGIYLYDSYVHPTCVGANIVELQGTAGCVCDGVGITQLGFPVRWTGYGMCSEQDNKVAFGLDIGIGVIVELMLIWLAIKALHNSR